MSGARRAEARVLSARFAQTVNATTATVFSTPTAAVHANASGNLIGTLAGDSSTTTFVVVQGVMYPYSFTSIDATNAVQIVALFNTDAPEIS